MLDQRKRTAPTKLESAVEGGWVGGVGHPGGHPFMVGSQRGCFAVSPAALCRACAAAERQA